MEHRRGRPYAAHYRIRSVGKGHGITIPTPMADLIPDNIAFVPEWHDEGILLRAVPITGDSMTTGPTPSWAKTGNE